MSLYSDAERFQDAVAAFHTHHSAKTFHAGVPGVDPWLRDTLISLQATLNQLATLQVAMARQIDQNTENLRTLAYYIQNPDQMRN